MKKYIIIAISIAAILLMSFNSKVASILHHEKTVSKNIAVTVSTNNNYASEIYNDAYAQITITITKISASKKVIVWQKNFEAAQLKTYAALSNSALQHITVGNIINTKEKLEVTCDITYNNNGSILRTVSATEIKPAENNRKLFINI
jgi:hypothetical protein